MSTRGITSILFCGLLLVPALAQERDRDSVPPDPEYRFSMPALRAARGRQVLVPIFLRSPEALSMVSWSVEFDPRVAEVMTVELSPQATILFERMPIEIDFERHVNREESYVQVSLIVDVEAREHFAIPPRFSFPIAYIRFRIRSNAPDGRHPLRFTRVETARYPGHFRDEHGPVYNRCRRYGRPFTRDDRFREDPDGHVVRPETDDGELVLSIIGDVGIFVRGDSNVDLEIDISDPVHILDHLFVASEELRCPEAADVNRDQSIDISDPIMLLDYLFVGSRGWRPTEEPVHSGAPTALGCDEPPISRSGPN